MYCVPARRQCGEASAYHNPFQQVGLHSVVEAGFHTILSPKERCPVVNRFMVRAAVG